MPRHRIGDAFAVAALLALAAPAAAETDEEVLKELRALRERVQELEAWKADRQAQDAAGDDDLAQAVESYLASRGDLDAGTGIVVAPRSKKIELGGMVRVRAEMLRRTPQPPDKEGRHTNEYVLGRTRLHAKAHIADNLKAMVEIQDARVWGEEDSTAADGDGVDLSQGYVDFLQFWGDTDARLGRQKVAISDQRFIGHLEWANAGRRFDGLTVEHRAENSHYTGFAYRLADGFADGDISDDDADLIGLWSFFPGLVDLGQLEVFALWLNDTRDRPGEPVVGKPPSEGHTKYGTYGVRFHGDDEDSGLDWDFQGAMQNGDLGGDDLSAWAVRGELGMTFPDMDYKPRFGFEWNYATGDEDPTDGDADTFQTLFPTNHGYYGIHDLAAWSNLNAWSVNAGMKLADDVTFKAAYWRFKLAEEEGGWHVASGKILRPGVRDAGRSLGHELDMVITWKQSDRVTWQLGWAHFWAGAFARQTEPDGSSSDSDFLYLQTLVTF
jgi:hypothetical protein